jgi:methyl-accepting chemotaxis protein
MRAVLPTTEIGRARQHIVNHNGLIPSHLSDHSRKPTGEYVHDLQFCRNGRIIITPFDKRVKQSTKPYSMAAYRFEGDCKQYRVVRLVSVPMMIGGRR